MKIVLLQVADWANITNDGKLNIMGIFTAINAPKFPARHPSMHLIISLEAELGEHGKERDLTVILMDADGREILQIPAKIKAPEAEGGKRSNINAIFELKDIVFPQPGPYSFVVLVDKDHKGDLPLYVNEIQPEKPSGG